MLPDLTLLAACANCGITSRCSRQLTPLVLWLWPEPHRRQLRLSIGVRQHKGVGAILKPIGIGMLGFVLSAFICWTSTSILIASDVVGAFPWVILFCVVVSLLAAGYLGARFTVSRHWLRRTIVGTVAGSFSFVLLLSTVADT